MRLVLTVLVDISPEEFVWVDHIFYEISSVSVEIDGEGNKTDMSVICSGGYFFTCNLPVEEVDTMIMFAKGDNKSQEI